MLQGQLPFPDWGTGGWAHFVPTDPPGGFDFIISGNNDGILVPVARVSVPNVLPEFSDSARITNGSYQCDLFPPDADVVQVETFHILWSNPNNWRALVSFLVNTSGQFPIPYSFNGNFKPEPAWKEPSL